MTTARISPELLDILREFSREQGWTVGLPESWTRNYVFSKHYSIRPKRQGESTRNAIATIELDWSENNPTLLSLGHPKFKMSIDGEKYTNHCSWSSDDVRMIQLHDPDSIEQMKVIFRRPDDEFEDFIKNTIWRHKVGMEFSKKQRKKGGKKARRNR